MEPQAQHRGAQVHPDPRDLPRQRRGTTPQRHGRYPDYDVLAEAEHWDETTRKVVVARIEHVPRFRFFHTSQRATLKAFCDTVTAQDAEPRIPVLAFVDAKLHEGRLDGYRYYDLPDDGDVWRAVARGLDEAARADGAASFADAPIDVRADIVHRFAQGRLFGGTWTTLNVSRAWKVLMRHIVEAFYAHPWAWNEIGFGGPAYPRGYSRFGSPHIDTAEREEWEGAQAFVEDPVRATRARGFD